MSVSRRTYWTLPRRELYKKMYAARSAFTEYGAKLHKKFDMTKYFITFILFFVIFLIFEVFGDKEKTIEGKAESGPREGPAKLNIGCRGDLEHLHLTLHRCAADGKMEHFEKEERMTEYPLYDVPYLVREATPKPR